MGKHFTSRRIFSLYRELLTVYSVDRNYPSRDPPLTKHGIEHAKSIRPPFIPDLILISPMTRALQTAILAFPDLIGTSHPEIEVQIWPELREAHDAPFNKGVGRAEISEKFPQFDFSSCPEEWDHAPHSTVTATVRAEGVRLRLKELAEKYRDILVISHRGFLAFMVQGSRFQVCGKFTVHSEALRMLITM